MSFALPRLRLTRPMALMASAIALFTYTAPVAYAQSAPSITSYSVTSSSGTTSITLSGSGFGTSASSDTVVIDGINAQITAVSDTSITATLPTNGGPGSIQVTTPAGSSNSLTFSGVERGYYVLSSSGIVKPYGPVKFYGDLSTLSPAVSATAVQLIPTADYKGYWIMTQSGHIYAFGDASSLTSPSLPSGVTATTMAITSNGKSGELLASNGTVYPIGSASAYGNAPSGTHATSLALTPTGQGYWILGSHGTVYPFGDAKNYGNAPISSTNSLPTYSSGSLLKVKNTSPVFVLLNGKLHHIPNMSIFNGLGFSWSQLKTVSSLANYSVGRSLVTPYLSGTLLQTSGHSTVYLVKQGILRPITSSQIQSMGLASVPVHQVSSIASNWPMGSSLSQGTPYYPSGTVLRVSGSPTVYMVANGVLDPIASASVFTAMGYHWSDIQSVSTKPSLAVASPLTQPQRAYPTGTLLRAANTSPVYLDQNGILRHVPSPQALTSLGFSFTNVKTVSSVSGYPTASALGSTTNPSPTAPSQKAVTLVPTSDGQGYWVASSLGKVYALGDATSYGSPSASQLNGGTVTAMAVTPDQKGYVVMSNNHRVYAFGDATSYGDPSASTGIAISPVTSGNILSMAYGFFNDSNTNRSVADLQQNGSQLSTIQPAWFNIHQNTDGSWSISNWTSQVPTIGGQTNIQYVTALAHQQHTLVMPSIATSYNPAKGPITSSSDVSSMVQQIVNLVQNNNFDGITIDFENQSGSSMSTSQASQQYTYFISKLGPALHAIGKKLMVAVYASSYPNTIYNYQAIAPYVDYINLMDYPQHNASTQPGPTAGYPWVQWVVQNALATGVSPQQLVLGVAPYGHYWTLSNSSGVTGNTYISNRKVQALLAKDNITPTWDPVQKEIFFTAGSPASAPTDSLSQNTSHVRQTKVLQALLNYILARYNIEHGQNPPTPVLVNGYYGSVTASYVTQFQQDFNVSGATAGVYDSATQSALSNLISQWNIGQNIYWDETSRSFQDRLSLALKYNLAGVAAWRLPFETQGYWTALTNNASVIH